MGTKGPKERAESCGCTSRNSKTCLGDRPDSYVNGGVEKVRALFEIMKIGKADNGDCGGAVRKLDLRHSMKYISAEIRGSGCWGEEKDCDWSMNEDSHGTDSENRTNSELGPAIHL